MESKKINQLATEMSPAATDLTIIGDPITGVSKKVTLEQISSLFAGLVSFYDNLASFPLTGSIDVIYCAKDTKKLYLWNGAYIEIFPSQALLDTYQLRSEKGLSNGYASLDSLGKVPIAQLPASIMEYKGMWSAATNTPTLANGAGDTGDLYICNAAGTVDFGAGAITFAVGDYVVYSGSIWQRSSGAVGTVTSVALTESGDSLNITGSPITTSGTINIGFNGNSGQYINGAGNLTTFPSLTGFVPYTGATANVDLGTYGLLADYLKLNVLPTSIPTTESTLSWNDTDGTMDIKLKGGNVTLQVGQEQVVRIVNKSGASLLEADYKVVRIRSVAEGGAQGQRLAVVLAQGDTAAHSKGVLGLVTETIADNQEGFITILGQVHEIDTTGTLQGETWVDGDKLYLSAATAGKLTNVAPVAPNHSVVMGYVEYAHAIHGKIFVNVNEGISVDELHDVYAPSPSANQSIWWNASTLRYENNTIAGVLGYTPVPTTRTLTINGVGYDLSADRSWSIVAGVSSVTATSPLFSSGGANPNITIQQASGSQAGYLSAADWTEFNTKQEQIDGLGFVKVSGTTLTYDNSSYTPISRTLTINGTTYDLSANRTWTIPTHDAVTIGTANGLSLAGQVLSLALSSTSTNGALSSTDWNTFNNKQSALTNPVTGTGTTNYLPKFTGASTIGDSAISDNGTTLSFGRAATFSSSVTAGGTLSIGTTSSNYKFSLKEGGVGGAPLFGFIGNASNGNWMRGYWLRSDETTQIAQLTVQDADAMYIGTSTAIPFILQTSATERMRITSGGNVLIGTTTDAGYKLDVNGTGRFSSTLYVTNVNGNFLQSTRSGTSAQFQTWYASDGTTRRGYFGFGSGGSDNFQLMNEANGSLGIGTNGTINLTLASSGAATFSSSVTAASGVIESGGFNIKGTGATAKPDMLRLSNASAGAYYWDIWRDNTTGYLNFGGATGGSVSTFLTIKDVSGNVGIGTTSPGRTLEVSKPAGVDFGLTSVTSGTAEAIFKGYASGTNIDATSSRGTVLNLINLDTTNGNANAIIFHNSNQLATSYIVGVNVNHTSRTGDLVFGTSNAAAPTERMRITSGGNLLVGTTTDAGYKLDVNGQVRATAFFESSSVAYKNILETNPLTALNIDVIKYTRKSDENKDIRYGYSAEQIHSLLPELTDKDVTAVKYLDVHTILIANLQREIKELKAKLN